MSRNEPIADKDNVDQEGLDGNEIVVRADPPADTFEFNWDSIDIAEGFVIQYDHEVGVGRLFTPSTASSGPAFEYFPHDSDIPHSHDRPSDTTFFSAEGSDYDFF